jgi:hypothetical protein
MAAEVWLQRLVFKEKSNDPAHDFTSVGSMGRQHGSAAWIDSKLIDLERIYNKNRFLRGNILGRPKEPSGGWRATVGAENQRGR